METLPCSSQAPFLWDGSFGDGYAKPPPYVDGRHWAIVPLPAAGHQLSHPPCRRLSHLQQQVQQALPGNRLRDAVALSDPLDSRSTNAKSYSTWLWGHRHLRALRSPPAPGLPSRPVLPLCKVPSSATNPLPPCLSGLRLHRPDPPTPPFLCSNRTSSRGWAHLIVRAGVAVRPTLRSGQPGRTLASGTPRLGHR